MMKNSPFNRQPNLLSCINYRAALFRAYSRDEEDGQAVIWFKAIPIIRYTPCGAWINYDNYSKPRFVNLRAVKQWASVTQDEAVGQLLRRKVAQIRILGNQLDHAMRVKYLIEQTPELDQP